MDGWIKLHRKVLENPVVCKDGDHLSVWVYLLLSATHDEIPVWFKGRRIVLMPGQLITGRLKIASELSINESKVKRILSLFKSDQQIDQQTSNKNSLITILNWCNYQKHDQQNDHPVDNGRPASDQPVTTNKNVRMKEVKKKDSNIVVQPNAKPEIDDLSKYPYKEIVTYLNTKAGTGFKDSSKDTRKHIKARIDDGFTLENFKTVIDKKVAEWRNNPEMSNYLRPYTLFGTKFEAYLNQKNSSKQPEKNKFNNFEQRDYDFAALEKQLLNR